MRLPVAAKPDGYVLGDTVPYVRYGYRITGGADGSGVTDASGILRMAIIPEASSIGQVRHDEPAEFAGFAEPASYRLASSARLTLSRRRCVG